MENSTHLHSRPIPSSELILRPDGSVYHLAIKPEQLADTVLIVGDPNRVQEISDRFDTVEHKAGEREFHTHTGTLRGKRLSVVSTGIGVDNVDIVMNELDALKNIDLETRLIRPEQTSMDIIRLGTSGTMQADIAVGSVVGSRYAMGNDGVPYFYSPRFEEDEQELMRSFKSTIDWPQHAADPYAVRCSDKLWDQFSDVFVHGITLTANGFYGPQGRSLRLPLQKASLTDDMASFSFRGTRITNYEMECAGLYALGGMLGHQMLTMCTILANRATKSFAEQPQKHISALIDKVLTKIT